MSSIKRDVKKKLLPRPEGQEDFVSRFSPLHCQSASRFAREVLLLSCLPFLLLSSSGGDHANRVSRHGKRDGYLSGSHSSIGGSWPIAISIPLPCYFCSPSACRGIRPQLPPGDCVPLGSSPADAMRAPSLDTGSQVHPLMPNSCMDELDFPRGESGAQKAIPAIPRPQ